MSSLEIGSFFSQKYSKRVHRTPQKFLFSIFINKKVGKIVIMNHFEWLSFYVIYLKISEKSCCKQSKVCYDRDG